MTELYHITRSYFVTYTRRTSQLEKDCYLIELRTGNVNIARLTKSFARLPNVEEIGIEPRVYLLG